MFERFLTQIFITLIVFFSYSVHAYEPNICKTSPCEVLAADYIEIAAPSSDTVTQWVFKDVGQTALGMTVNRTTGVFTWTPDNSQLGTFIVDINGLNSNSNVETTLQISITVSENSNVDWESLIFVAPREFAPATAGNMDGSMNAPFSQEKLGSQFCRDSNKNAITTDATVYFRGGIHSTDIGVNPSAIFCNGLSLAKPFVLTAWGNERPVLSPKGTEAVKIQGDFVTISGFEVAGHADKITTELALEDWWSENRPATSEGYLLTSQGILAKGDGIVIENNIVHSWPGNAVKVEGDLSTVQNNIVFNSGYYSTRGVGGVMVEGLNNSPIDMPADRDYGIIVRNNIIFGNESRIISHVFSKGFTTLEIDEGSSINLQQNGGNHTRGYLVENNAILFNGKGPGLRAKYVVFKNNTVVGNGLNIRAPGAAGVRATKITTSGLASEFNGDAGSIASLVNNIISVPKNQEAISIDGVSRITGAEGCRANLIRGIVDDANGDCSTLDNTFIVNSPVLNAANNNFNPITGSAGADTALIPSAIQKLASYGYELKPSGFDIMSLNDYDDYVLPMINTILKTTPQGDGGVELIYEDENGNVLPELELNDNDYHDITSVNTVRFNWLGSRPLYNAQDRFPANYVQYIKPAPDPLYAIQATVTPVNGGVVKCSDISIRSTKNQRDVSCQAEPFDGFEFSSWSGACSGSSCEIASVSGDISIVAAFTPINSDQTPPVITVPDDITVNAFSSTGTPATNPAITAFLNAATATDTVDGALNVTNNAPSVFPLGTTTVTFSATDSAGNTSSNTATVTVQDKSAPTVTVPANITVGATNASGTPATNAAIIAFLNAATATDTVDGSLSVTNNAPSVFPLGVTTVTFSATDSAGNTSSNAATVTVQDQSAPTVTVPANITVEATTANGTPANNPAITAFLNAATATDTVDGALNVTNNAPSVFPLGVTTVTFSATDSAGNTSSNTATVTVQDQGMPTVTAPADITVQATTADGTPATNATITAFLNAATATDTIDGALDVTNNAPSVFPLGMTTVTFSATDSAGNTASESAIVTIEDTEKPELTVPSDLLLDVLNPGDTVSITDERVQQFIEKATAFDEIDGDLSNQITQNIPQSMGTGRYIIEFSVIDSAGNSASDFSAIEVVIRDTDDDGIPDYVEIANGLDPNDPNDAQQDKDGDGVSNLEEYQRGSDISKDDYAPELEIPEDLALIARGKFTEVDLGIATAIDGKDGELTPLPSFVGPFESGVTEVIWSVEDSEGNEAVASQFVTVTPLVELTTDQDFGEGSTTSVQAVLSGEAVNYPVIVDLTVSGSATEEDYTLSSNKIFIESGTTGSVELSILEDDVFDTGEDIVFTVESVENAVAGTRTQSTITIVEENVAPIVQVKVIQGDRSTRIVTQDGGDVGLVVEFTDINLLDNHTIQFDGALNALPEAIQNDSILEFNPQLLSTGLFTGSVTVTDDGQGQLATTTQIAFRVVDSAPELAENQDSDGDGIPDSEEGYGDTDNDGIPDFKDYLAETHLAPMNEFSTGIAESEVGTSISLGLTAFQAGIHGINVTEDTRSNVSGFEAFSSNLQILSDTDAPSMNDALFNYPQGRFDFILQGAKLGYSYRILLPLDTPIPSRGTVRVFSQSTGWHEFEVDADNAIASAPKMDSNCPALGSNAYVPGLTEGDVCLQLLIEDGGVNDADELIDGKVTHLGGIAVRAVSPPDSERSTATFSLTSLEANGSDTAELSVTARDENGNLLTGLSVSAITTLGTISDFSEIEDGLYTALFKASETAGVATVTITLSDGEEQAFVETQIELTDNQPVESGGALTWTLFAWLVTLIFMRRCLGGYQSYHRRCTRRY